MKKSFALVLCLLLVAFAHVGVGLAWEPGVDLKLTSPETPQDVIGMLNIFLVLTVLSLAPAILVLMTSFTRSVIVLSFTRNALATQQVPPNQVIVGLSLFLTLFIMAPVFTEINEQALQPYLSGELTQEEALRQVQIPLREFMLTHTRARDLELFADVSGVAAESVDEIPTLTIIPAFVISELKTAFQMGFLIFVPFLVIDMVIASTLMSMGMMMLPPVMISLPFKILLFVLVDGWHLVVKSLLQSF
ncbi:MAG TPA: flagellar biosynthetic protein FliP [Firmicutes bacterium]|nr:flagellar biosynthetic protein FliP [Bacillota bacterium]